MQIAALLVWSEKGDGDSPAGADLALEAFVVVVVGRDAGCRDAGRWPPTRRYRAKRACLATGLVSKVGVIG